MTPHKQFLIYLFTLFLTFLFINATNAQTGEILDNKEIIELVQSGLPQSIIIKKIEESPNRFDLSTDALIELTNSDVPEEIINVMLESTENKVSEHHKLIQEFDEAGIYYIEGEEAPSGLKFMSPTVIDKLKEGSFGSHMAGALTAAAKKKVRAIVSGDRANLATHKKPVFFFYFGDGTESSSDKSNYDPNDPVAMMQAMKNMSAPDRIAFSGITSPNEIRLVKTEVKKNERRFVASSASGMTRETGIDSDYVVNFKYERLQEGLYKVYVENVLEPGEYMFVYAGRPLYSGQYVYDFSVK